MSKIARSDSHFLHRQNQVGPPGQYGAGNMPQQNNMGGMPQRYPSAGPGGLSNQMAGMSLNQTPTTMVSLL